ncbi:hypothetical protein D3C85_1247910 [compost metagenome]
MRVIGKAVAALAGVDDQDLAARTREGQRGGQAGIAAANDDDVIKHGKLLQETFDVS